MEVERLQVLPASKRCGIKHKTFVGRMSLSTQSRLRINKLVDDKSVTSCQQTCSKLIVETSYPQACCKFFEVLKSL